MQELRVILEDMEKCCQSVVEFYYKKMQSQIWSLFGRGIARLLAKRRQLQKGPSKRQGSASALSITEFKEIVELWDEDVPEGLQENFNDISSYVKG